MALDQSVRSDPAPAFGATLPMTALPRFSGLELLAAVNKILQGAGVTATLEPELTTFDASPGERVWNRPKAPPRIGLSVNGVTILVEGHDRPAFRPSELARLDIRSWPEGRARVSRARCHVEITEVDVKSGADLDHNYDRAAAVTVVAAAVAGLAGAAAVVWHASRRAVAGEELAPLVAALAAGQAPVPLWLGCVARPAGARGVATRGLYALLGAEIEIASRNLPVEAAFEVAQELAAEIFRTGGPPEEGARLGYDRTTEFGVRYRSGSHAGAVPAVVLTQVTEPAGAPARVPVGGQLAAGAA
ncbi:MAG: hypothetical protein IID49_15605 [Proteobacteria bacterium]|nr:hypothetical protein [Pseudomonadota bacterium]